MKAHFYPPGNSTWHPLDGWNSPGISALHLGFWQPRVKMSVQPSQTKVWSEVIPRNWPVLQSCLHRYWGRTGNWYQGTFSERKLVKRRKNILLGGMLHSSGALEFEIKCSQIDLISAFCPGIYFIESVTNWPLQGSHRSCPAFFCGLFWMFSGSGSVRFQGSSLRIPKLFEHTLQQKQRHSVSLRNRLLNIKGCNHFKASGSYTFSSPAYWCRT